MKKKILNWKNQNVTVFWPDYPFVIAGNEVLVNIINAIESNDDLRVLSNYLADKFKVDFKDAEQYIKNIQSALNETGVLANKVKSLKNNADKKLQSVDENNLAMATVNVTRKCNLKCRHCYAGGGREKIEEMTTDGIKKVVSNLGMLIIKEPRLLILSGGEPTLEREKIKTAIETARQYELNLRLNTNGVNMDKDFARYLADNEVLVQVSLDGHNEETNKVLRGTLRAFNDAVSAVKQLVSAGCRTRISCTIHSGNVYGIPKMLDMAEDLGVEQFTTSSLVNIGNALMNDVNPVEYKEEFDILYNAVKGNEKRQRMTKSTLFAETVNAIRAGIKFTYCGTGQCTCCVDSDGSLYPCINLVRKDFNIGNILRSNFPDLWKNSSQLHELRSLNVDSLNAQCSDCDFRYFCGGYCRGETIASGGNLNSPYYRCTEWKRGIIKIMNVLSADPNIYYFGEDPYKGVMHRE